MQQQGLVPDMFTYIVVIGHCVFDFQPKQAVEVFKTMQKFGVVAEDIDYKCLTDADVGKWPEQVLGEVMEEVFRAMQRQGVPPTRITYSSLISAHEKGK